MTATQLNNALTWAEVDGTLAPDCRRVLQKERVKLTAALRSGGAEEIIKAKAAAESVAEMWGVDLTAKKK